MTEQIPESSINAYRTEAEQIPESSASEYKYRTVTDQILDSGASAYRTVTERMLNSSAAYLAELPETILQGKAPYDPDLLLRTSVGIDALTEFLEAQYLKTYIPEGGSKIKFVTGRPGSGKTQFARLMTEKAASESFLTVYFSAKEVWLHDFREIYLEIYRQCSLEQILKGCADQIVRSMNYDPADIPEGKTFMDYLSGRGEADSIARGEIRNALRTFFIRNPMLDNGFAACCSILTGGILGHPVLEAANRDLILRFMSGDKTVRLGQMRALGLSPARVTKYNARNLLRSLAEIAHLGGYAGIQVVIDDVEMLLNRSAGTAMRYTKLRREDAYESIRQLIDDMDSLRYTFFILCFDRELMDNDSYGMKSYQALWMRVQNEIVSTRFNKFADILDLDRYAEEFYNEETLCEMAERLNAVLEEAGIEGHAVDAELAGKLIGRARYGGLGLPYMVNRAVVEGIKENE